MPTARFSDREYIVITRWRFCRFESDPPQMLACVEPDSQRIQEEVRAPVTARV